MKVKLKSTGGYVGLNHLVGKTFEAVKISSCYTGYYVEVPISRTKTSSLYFLPWEVEEVKDDCEFPTQHESKIAKVSFSFVLVVIIIVTTIICNLIINKYV
jgi:hypothetical protein